MALSPSGIGTGRRDDDGRRRHRGPSSNADRRAFRRLPVETRIGIDVSRTSGQRATLLESCCRRMRFCSAGRRKTRTVGTLACERHERRHGGTNAEHSSRGVGGVLQLVRRNATCKPPALPNGTTGAGRLTFMPCGTRSEPAVSNLKRNRGSENGLENWSGKKHRWDVPMGGSLRTFLLGMESQRWPVILRWKNVIA